MRTPNSRRLIRGGLILLTTLILISIAAEYEPRVSTTVQLANETVTLRFLKNPKPLPPLVLHTIDGRTISSTEWHGRVTLVNFWATWCRPCEVEVPELVVLQEKYRDHLRIIGISEDRSTDLVKRFAGKHRINYPLVMATRELEHAFAGIPGLPITFILDRDGRILQKHVGLLNPALTEQEIRVLAGL
jgi:thiol-disulfide isomerase/thioredoxin